MNKLQYWKNEKDEHVLAFHVTTILKDWENERAEIKRVINNFLNSCTDNSDNYIGGSEKLELLDVLYKMDN